MGYPWDTQNIQTNLRVLASLQVGNKLSVLKSGSGDIGTSNLGRKGRGLREIFQVQAQIGFFQSKERKKKGETLLDDEQYRKPLTLLFKRAVDEWRLHGIRKREMFEAVEGLRRMRTTYLNEGKRQHVEKMEQILFEIERMLPNPNGFELRGEMDVSLLLQPEFRDLKESVYTWLEFSDDADLNREAEGSSEERIQIYGADLPSLAPPTRLPTLALPYQRKKLGVCPQFIKDFNRGNNNLVNGIPHNASAGDIAHMLELFGGDEAMLFVVSQLGTQAGMAILMTNLSTYRKPKYKREQRFASAFQYQGRQLTTTGVKQVISVWADLGPAVTVGAEVTVTLDTPLFSWENFPTDMIEPGDIGIQHLSTEFTMQLQRVGNEIQWDLVQADLHFVGTS